jgi:hypothetical protein
MAKGMILSVYRDADRSDCTNNGISGKVARVTLCGPGIPEIFEAKPDAPEFRLVVRWEGTKNEYKHIEPVEQPKGAIGPMAGGNFAASCDSRVRDICAYPLPIHDRFETAAQYAANFD